MQNNLLASIKMVCEALNKHSIEYILEGQLLLMEKLQINLT